MGKKDDWPKIMIMTDKEIKKKYAKAKTWLEPKCQEIELLNDCSSKVMYGHIRELSGRKPNPEAQCMNLGDIANHSNEFFGEVFQDNATEEIFLSLSLSGPPILKDEIHYTLRKLKPEKAAIPDEVLMEMVKALDEEGIDLLHSLIS